MKKDRSKIGRTNRRRGADFERAVVNYLKEALKHHANVSVRRRMQWSGNNDPDIGIYVDGDNNPVWHIECKCMLHPRTDAAISQAINHARPGAMVAVVIRDRRYSITKCYVIQNRVVTYEDISLSDLAGVISDCFGNTN